MWKDIINLITETKTTNTLGDVVSVRATKTVFANAKSVRQSEFYQAMAQGLRPVRMFELYIADYNGQQIIQHESVELKVIRTYEKDSDILEIICQGVV